MMTLYDLVDSWLESEQYCPVNYSETYTHEQMCDGLRAYAQEKNISLLELSIDFAVALYEEYCASAKKKDIPWEEFSGADKLRDISIDMPQDSQEQSGKTLEELCDEPFQGEAIIGGVHVVVDSRLKDVTYNEVVNYIDFCDKHKAHKSDLVTKIELKPDNGDNISIDWTVKPLPFNHIRRITGYLVGDLNRWGNAKKAELRDRVKHTNVRGR